MFLVDTNIWLERLLDQKRTDEVARFLNRAPARQLYLTDFAYHSIGVILDRTDELNVFEDFTKDLFVTSDVNLVHLYPKHSTRIVDSANHFDLDFDDAYQLVAAQQRELDIVTLDADFDESLADVSILSPKQAVRRLG